MRGLNDRPPGCRRARRTGRSRWWPRKGRCGRGKSCRQRCRDASLSGRAGIRCPGRVCGRLFAPRQRVAKQESAGQPVHGSPGQSAPRLCLLGRPDRDAGIIRGQVNSRRTGGRLSSRCNGGRVKPGGRSPGAFGLIGSSDISPPSRRRPVPRATLFFPNDPRYPERPGGRGFLRWSLVGEQSTNKPVQTGAERPCRREPGLIGRAADECRRRPGNRHVGVDPKPRAALVAIRVGGRVFGGAPQAGVGQGDTALAQVGTGIPEEKFGRDQGVSDRHAGQTHSN